MQISKIFCISTPFPLIEMVAFITAGRLKNKKEIRRMEDLKTTWKHFTTKESIKTKNIPSEADNLKTFYNLFLLIIYYSQ